MLIMVQKNMANVNAMVQGSMFCKALVGRQQRVRCETYADRLAGAYEAYY